MSERDLEAKTQTGLTVHRQSIEEQEEEEEESPIQRMQQEYGNRAVSQILSRKAEGDAEVAPVVEDAIQRARGGGQALDSRVRAQMEPAFGADFRGVRVHADANADTLNRALNARAFTSGQDIFFQQGEYSPSSSSGRELLAHELTHVVQQNGDRVQRKLMVGEPDDQHEQEANQVASWLMQYEQIPRERQAVEQQAVSQREEKKKQPTQADLENGQVHRKDKATYVQPLGPHLYREIASGPAPFEGIPGLLWYRVYQTNPGVNVQRLYADLVNLYGPSRFHRLTPEIKSYLGLNIPWNIGQFCALYPSKKSREPVDTSRFESLEKGLTQPGEISRPGITSGFKERENEAWTLLSATARGFLTQWQTWSMKGLEKFLKEIPLETDLDLEKAITILGDLSWALTIITPVIGEPIKKVVEGLKFVSALTSLIEKRHKQDRQDAIQEKEEEAISNVRKELFNRKRISSVLITVLVKAEERGLSAYDRDYLLWDHMFAIQSGRSPDEQDNQIKLNAYYNLRRDYTGYAKRT